MAEEIARIDKGLNDPEIFQQIKDSNPEFEVKSKNEIRSAYIDNASGIFSATTTSTLALLGMLLLSTLYSLICTLLFRTIFKPR